MEDFIVIAILLVIVGLAVWYVIRAKKHGKKCIGCPDGCCTATKSKKGDEPACCCCGCGGESPAKEDQT